MWQCHLSGNYVVPNEDEVDVLVSSDAQRALDALQVCCNVWQSGRLCQAVAAQNTHTASATEHRHTMTTCHWHLYTLLIIFQDSSFG